MSILLAQLSDVHVRPRGVSYKGAADSNRLFAEAIEHLQALDTVPDLVLLTGDLVDEGRPDEYAMLRELLLGLRIPYRLMPGNHDARDALRSAFPNHDYLPAHGPLNHAFDAGPLQVIALDSCVPGQHHGEIAAPTLDWLRARLIETHGRPALVALHHPPFVSGIPFLDRFRLLDPGPLERVLAGFPNVEAVICGHVHRLMVRRWAGTVVVACPSTATQIALRLAPDAQPASFVGPRGCLLHRWEAGQGLVTHLSDIGAFRGPFPFF